jgi:hypothetical protein
MNTDLQRLDDNKMKEVMDALKDRLSEDVSPRLTVPNTFICQTAYNQIERAVHAPLHQVTRDSNYEIRWRGGYSFYVTVTNGDRIIGYEAMASSGSSFVAIGQGEWY